MKRIFSFALICVILVVSLAPAALAAESDSQTDFVDILDFCFPNGYKSSKVWIRDDGTLRTTFSFNESWTVHYFDLIFSIPEDRSVSGVKLSLNPTGGTYLTVQHISGNVYRAYGHVSGTSSALYIWVEGSSNWVNWYSVRVSLNPLSGYDEKATCDILAYGYSETINYNPSDLINYRSFIGANDPLLNSLNLYITCPNWRKYDFLDFAFSADVSAIDSIMVSLGDSFVPFDVSYIDNGSGIENHYYAIVRVDLRNLDHTSSEGLYLHVSGLVNTGSSNFISMDGCRGHISVAEFDSEIVWYKRIFSFLRDDFYFNIRSALEGAWAELERISDLISPDSSSSDSFKEDSSGAVAGLDDISSAIDSVNRPSMDSINADFSGDISDASVLMTGLFTEVTAVPWMFTIILASCVLGLISYILYGKD